MNREQACNYLRSSGFSEEQIRTIEGAFTCDKCVYSTSEGCQYDDITETIPPFEPSDDAINRQAAIDTIESWLSCDDYNEAERHIMRAMQSVLYDLPFVNPQKPKSECEHDHEILKAYSDGASAVLDRIRNEMHATAEKHEDGVYYLRDEWIDEIIDKYAEGSDKE